MLTGNRMPLPELQYKDMCSLLLFETFTVAYYMRPLFTVGLYCACFTQAFWRREMMTRRRETKWGQREPTQTTLPGAWHIPPTTLCASQPEIYHSPQTHDPSSGRKVLGMCVHINRQTSIKSKIQSSALQKYNTNVKQQNTYHYCEYTVFKRNMAYILFYY